MKDESIKIRPIQEVDRDEWARLWQGYLDFYETSVADDIYELTFSRLLSAKAGTHSGFVAVPGCGDPGTPLCGLVHYLYHAHSWKREPVCYLQDLYVDPGYRGYRVGRKLIERVYERADADGAPGVYWMTQDFNTGARKLYDRIAKLTPFIKYQRA